MLYSLTSDVIVDTPNYNKFLNPENQLDTKKEKLHTDYGDWFCDIVGTKRLLEMPRITALITEEGPITINPFTINDLDEDRAVKGKDSQGRSYIALKVAVYDNDDQLLYHCVELIYACYKENTDFYVSALQNKCDDGKTRPSHLNINERRLNIDKLPDFFDEEKIRTSLMPPNIYIKWA